MRLLLRFLLPASVLLLSLLPRLAIAGLDGDGFTPQDGDCDDTRDWVHPGAEELCDGLDGDCDGAVPAEELDADGDGWSPCSGDCDELDPLRHPHADEGCDGIDTDCLDGPRASELDVDGDGQAPCSGDCDDDNRSVRLGALEQCDALDNDCDALVDEGCESEEPREDEGGEGGCTNRGCGWSLGPSAAGLAPFVVVCRSRRRRRGSCSG